MDTRGQYGNRAGLIGNPIQQTTDAYGNPLPSQEGTGLHGTTGVGGGGKPQMTHPEKEQRGGGILHRSGSSSSSSSEDDGMGGRRKKGLKEKIKEKLPGGRKTDEQGQGYGQGQTATGPGTGYGGTTTATTGTAGHNNPEKKGFMGKIKENLPGGRKTDEQGPGQGYGHVPITTGPGTGYGGTTTGPGTGYGGTTTATTGTAGHNDPEKMGCMGKIKEKLPGGRKTDEQGQGQGYGHVPITTGPATGYGGTTTATTGTAGHNDPEKKGFMGKIKEKLPGHQ